jgi:glycosyltransferase involved in cell wall biosynthesis
VSAIPRLSIGLPVYNGEDYLPQALDALLGQSYHDFELIIADNASTDATEKICREYADQDERVRYLRQPYNKGISENHNVLVRMARGELFKWVGHDDLFARELLARCVEQLDANPDAVLATSWTALINETDELKGVITQYPAGSDSPRAAERYEGLLHAVSGDDDYGVIRIDALRRTPLLGSYYHADRALVAELSLYGRFLRIPEPLYFRRDLESRAGRPEVPVRQWCVSHDPRRADTLRHPRARLLAEYLWAFADGIRRSPLPGADKLACYRVLASYLGGRALRRTAAATSTAPPSTAGTADVDVAELVPGRKESPR